MVMAEIASKNFNWRPNVIESDNPQIFEQTYYVEKEANTTTQSFQSSFADLPSAGIWKNRVESDNNLLEELGGNWRSFEI